MKADLVESLRGMFGNGPEEEQLLDAAAAEIERLQLLCGELAKENASLAEQIAKARRGRTELEKHYKNEIKRIHAFHKSEAHFVLLLKERVISLESKCVAAGIDPGETTLPDATQRKPE